MDKRKLHMPVLAGILAFAMVLDLFAGFLPTKVDAASSSELKAQLDALEQQSENLDEEIAQLQYQISENSSEIEVMVAEKNVIDQEIANLNAQIDICNEQIASFNLLIADKQEELDEAEAALKAAD